MPCMGEKLGASVLKKLIPKNILKTKTHQLHDIQALTNSILNHIDSGHFKKAVSIVFSKPAPFPFPIYARLFQQCSSERAAIEARIVESHLVTFNPRPPVFLINRAIETYGKCGCLKDARGLFDDRRQRNGGTWNAMITAYSQNGDGENALLVFWEMHRSGVLANEITFASVLGSCAGVLDIYVSRQVHGLVVNYGFCFNAILASSLVDIYGKCWFMDDARRMFYEIRNPNAISWNVIVRRYLEVDNYEEAVVMFFKMVGTNVMPLTFTFSSALVACSNIPALKEGEQIHAVAVKVCFVKDKIVVNSLINMYAKCGDLVDARRLFDQPGSRDVITWTSIVSAYAACGRIREARKLFNDMPERGVISWNAMLVGYTRLFQWEEALDFIFWMHRETNDFDSFSLSLILNVCAGLSDILLGKQAHGFAYRHDLHSNTFVANAILDMYGKCGSLRSSRVWFSEMGHLRDRVSWNAFISSYARHGLSEKAIPLFGKMILETTGTELDFSTLLAACANIFALDEGKQTHAYMLRNGFNIDVVTRGALVDMYSKCRCLEYAIKVFEESSSSDLILWNSMVLGCAHNGKGGEVLGLFESMQEEGIKCDNVTFQGVLLACIGEGFVDLGKQYFDSMSKDFCIIPRLEHYECMIELYSRYGYMDELKDFVQNMPFHPTVPMLTRIFDACREYRHSELGEWAAQRLNEFKPLIPFQFEIFPDNHIDTL
ncbi:hypothetical protein IFM89_027239 [Coptis chinensis]|uniref:Pentatricopeptide repeat-containing protein n=1 Tax=Coptis chinensis TaxID=261450 RepID=A0A835LWR9_9MAGN|nr:hypothetical protein IFM89_027239 [Coptis chinensis]